MTSPFSLVRRSRRETGLQRSALTLFRHMLLFTDRGQRSVADADVPFVYRGATVASYCGVTVVMANGEEISGRTLTAAVDALQAKLNDMTPPPMAA
jgi:hypothetical protein